MRPIQCLMMALLASAMCPMSAHAEDSATPEVQASAGVETRQQDNATDHADTIKKIIEGGPEESAQALLELTDTPNTALDHCELLLNAVPNCSGDLDLAYIPETMPLINPEWPRPAKILIWLAVSVYNSDNSMNRTKAQDDIFAFCQEVLFGKRTCITKGQAFEACIRALYSSVFRIEPQDHIKEKVLHMIRMLVQPEAIKKLNDDSGQIVYRYCVDAELDAAMQRVYGKTYSCGGNMRKEFRRYDLYGSPVYDIERVCISESEYYELRAKPPSEVIQSYMQKECLYADEQTLLSLLLARTRKMQSENIKELFVLNTKGNFSLYGTIIPVYDVSLEYEKRIVDEQIKRFEEKISKPDLMLRCKGAPRRITSVEYGLLMVQELLNKKARSPKRTDIYRRDDLLKLITDQIMSENPESCVAGLQSGINIIDDNSTMKNNDNIEYDKYCAKTIANAISESIKMKHAKMEESHGALANANEINECLRMLDHVAQGSIRPWIQPAIK